MGTSVPVPGWNRTSADSMGFTPSGNRTALNRRFFGWFYIVTSSELVLAQEDTVVHWNNGGDAHREK
jgi:hypothetical protein